MKYLYMTKINILNTKLYILMQPIWEKISLKTMFVDNTNI